MFKKVLYITLLTIPIFTSTLNIKQEFEKMLETSNYNVEKLNDLKCKCNDDDIEEKILVAINIGKAEEYAKNQKLLKAKRHYESALSSIINRDLKIFESLKPWLEGEINTCIEKLDRDIVEGEVISSKEIDRTYIATRSVDISTMTRDARLEYFKTLRGLPLNFKTDSSKIEKGVNLKQAQEIAKAISKKKYIKKKIYITGYTDTRGGAKYNQRLSERRAKSLKAFLLKKNSKLKGKNIIADGEGEFLPICKNGTKRNISGDEYECSGVEDYAKSRRVTIEYGG